MTVQLCTIFSRLTGVRCNYNFELESNEARICDVGAHLGVPTARWAHLQRAGPTYSALGPAGLPARVVVNQHSLRSQHSAPGGRYVWRALM